MRTNFSITKLSLIFAAAVLLKQWGNAQPASLETPLGIESYGDWTNGIRGRVLIWHTNSNSIPIVSIYAVTTNANAFFPVPIPETEAEQGRLWTEMVGNDRMLYFASSNFCGPIELRNSTGKNMPLHYKTVADESSYPRSFSYVDAKRHRNQLIMNAFPRPLTFSPDELARFPLRDYFTISDGVEYDFKVWPKIYKRASTNSDLCERIDLPPVSVKIKTSAYRSPK